MNENDNKTDGRANSGSGRRNFRNFGPADKSSATEGGEAKRRAQRNDSNEGKADRFVEAGDRRNPRRNDRREEGRQARDGNDSRENRDQARDQSNDPARKDRQGGTTH